MGAERTFARAMEIQIEQNSLLYQMAETRKSVTFYQQILVGSEGDPAFNADYIKNLLGEENKKIRGLQARFSANQGRLRELHKTIANVMV